MTSSICGDSMVLRQTHEVPGTPVGESRLLHGCRLQGGEKGRFAMKIIHSAYGAVLAAALITPALSAPVATPPTTTTATPATTSPAAPTTTTTAPTTTTQMPTSNPYTPEHGTTPNGAPMPDTANQTSPTGQPAPTMPDPAMAPQSSTCPPTVNGTTNPNCVPAIPPSTPH